MIVLEEWLAGMFGVYEHRLAITRNGDLRVHYRDLGRWCVCEQDECLPLFAPTRKTRPTAPKKSRPRRKRS